MKLLDLFSGAGGAAMGYHRAGIDAADIVGVDIAPQPRYPFQFVQGDALEYLGDCWRDFDLIHASPPCQAYSVLRFLPSNRGREYWDSIPPTLAALRGTRRPWVLENVMGAKAWPPGAYRICGYALGLPFSRHRLFLTTELLLVHPHQEHPAPLTPRNGGGGVSRSRCSQYAIGGRLPSMGASRVSAGALYDAETPMTGAAAARLASGIDWMTPAELYQAIPPAYTEFIGRQLI